MLRVVKDSTRGHATSEAIVPLAGLARRCPLRVNRVGFVMSAVCPVNSQQQTFPDPAGTSHLGQKQTWPRVRPNQAVAEKPRSFWASAPS